MTVRDGYLVCVMGSKHQQTTDPGDQNTQLSLVIVIVVVLVVVVIVVVVRRSLHNGQRGRLLGLFHGA